MAGSSLAKRGGEEEEEGEEEGEDEIAIRTNEII